VRATAPQASPTRRHERTGNSLSPFASLPIASKNVIRVREVSSFGSRISGGKSEPHQSFTGRRLRFGSDSSRIGGSWQTRPAAIFRSNSLSDNTLQTRRPARPGPVWIESLGPRGSPGGDRLTPSPRAPIFLKRGVSGREGGWWSPMRRGVLPGRPSWRGRDWRCCVLGHRLKACGRPTCAWQRQGNSGRFRR
jgi:hypothetical protein